MTTKTMPSARDHRFYRVVCICNKIRKGVIEKAIRGGARSFEDINVAPARAPVTARRKRCGPVIREMLTKKAAEAPRRASSAPATGRFPDLRSLTALPAGLGWASIRNGS